MKQIANKLWPLILTMALILSACGSNEPEPTPIDPAAIFTAAAETVAAQMTQTAAAFTPTPQPTETPTLPPVETADPAVDTPSAPPLGTPVAPPAGIPTIGTGATATIAPLPGVATQSGPVCDDSVFIADITVPDYTEMVPGNDFEKIWRIQNTGTCTWDDGYYLAYAYGNEKLDGPGWKITRSADFVSPGATKDIGMLMTAPLAPGEYTSCWQMVNDRGVPFGTALCAIIKVVK